VSFPSMASWSRWCKVRELAGNASSVIWTCGDCRMREAEPLTGLLAVHEQPPLRVGEAALVDPPSAARENLRAWVHSVVAIAERCQAVHAEVASSSQSGAGPDGQGNSALAGRQLTSTFGFLDGVLEGKASLIETMQPVRGSHGAESALSSVSSSGGSNGRAGASVLSSHVHLNALQDSRLKVADLEADALSQAVSHLLQGAEAGVFESRGSADSGQAGSAPV